LIGNLEDVKLAFNKMVLLVVVLAVGHTVVVELEVGIVGLVVGAVGRPRNVELT
jgi:hypothetical protein